MLQKIAQNKSTVLLILLCLAALIAIRGFEDQWFYDPFLDYFKNDYLNLPFPVFEGFHLFLSMTFRFMLNTFFSLFIVHLLFKELRLTKFAGIIYGILFVVLMLFFFVLLFFTDESNNFLLFYIRRFIIQPLFLLLLIPAIYFQKRAE